MPSAPITGDFVSTLSFIASMAADPMHRMRAMGLDSPSAVMMNRGLSPSHSRSLVYLTGGENVRPILENPGTFLTANVPLRSSRHGAQARLRRGLIGSQGAEHAHYRASFLAQTGKSMMAEFIVGVARHIDAVLAGLTASEPVDLVTFINDLVRHYAVVTMFKEDNQELALEIGREITAWIDLGYNPANFLFPVSLPGLPHARYRNAADRLERKILQWVDLRRGMDPGRDIISMFVNGPDENGQPLTPDRLTGQILTIYAAAFSSSVAGILWSIFMLMQHPQIARNLCDELDGSGIDPRTDGVKLLELPLLDRVVKESMRLFTPVPYQVRRVAEDAQANGIELKAKDYIVVGSWATNRLASVYSEAEFFRPDRWLRSRPNPYEYLVFSAGPRRCVGYGMAMIMVKVTLASILLQRRPSLQPDTRIDMRVAVTLRSRQPIPVTFADRTTEFRCAPVRGSVTAMYKTA